MTFLGALMAEPSSFVVNETKNSYYLPFIEKFFPTPILEIWREEWKKAPKQTKLSDTAEQSDRELFFVINDSALP